MPRKEVIPISRELDELLTEAHREAGLRVEEPDDHILLLKRGDEILGRFIQPGATKVAIRTVADVYIR